MGFLLLLACAPKPPPPTGASEALEACFAGLIEARNGDAAQLLAAYARSCAGLYRQPACHDAVAGVMEVPIERRAWSVYSACRDAYCPILEPPLPEACTAPDPDVTELPGLWHPLHGRILAMDAGVTQDQWDKVSLNYVIPQKIFVPAMEPPPAPGPVVTIVVGDPPALRVGEVTVEFVDDPAALAARIGPLLGSDLTGTVTIRAPVQADFRTVRQILAALNTLGFTKVRFETAS